MSGLTAILLLAACQPHDFDADGKADLAFVDQSTGSYYRVGEVEPFWTPEAPGAEPWWEFIAAPGDYNGNGTWQPAVVSEHGWEARNMASFAGPVGVHLVPADYSGDGATDPAVYHDWDGSWHVVGLEPVDFGVGSDATCEWAKDTPTPGDFDGDGAAEIAVYRPTDQRFHFLDGTSSAPFAAGIPAVADYDGDGSDDLAVFDPLTNIWHFEDGTTLELELAAEIPLPAPADYDGDGTEEPVIFDYEHGRWLQAPDTLLADDPRAVEAMPTTLTTPAVLWDFINLLFTAILVEDGQLEAELAQC